ALSLSEEKAKSLLLEKQRLEDELQQTKVELDELFLHLADLEKKSTLSLDPTQIDTYWNKALETIAQHITLTLPLQTSTIQLVSTDEKWRDWQNWQHLEITHVQPLLSSFHITAGKAKTLDLLHVESAQKLLMLRWYLLE